MAWRYDDQLVIAGLRVDLSIETPRRARLVEPQELHNHDCVSTTEDTGVRHWVGERDRGKT